jgi:hypothetical protein
MDMEKTGRPVRTSSKSLSDAAGATSKADRVKIGDGSVEAWVNERGETCIGNLCFQFAVREDEDDVTVRIDRNKCDVDALPIIESILQAIGKGGRTVYETTSLIKKT